MRALLLILDGLGVGTTPNPMIRNEQGLHPLGRLFRHQPRLELPHLFSLGLREILSGTDMPTIRSRACYGRIKATAPGKELISAHWEIAGVEVKEAFTQCARFPSELLIAIETDAKVKFIGNCTGKGPAILEKFGDIHLKTGRPILYTSSHSVMQIATHEKIIPRKRLYEICRIARRHCDSFRTARVIARPFIGTPGNFNRPEKGRLDFPLLPPRTIFNAISEKGLPVESVGKIGRALGFSGITARHPADSNHEGMKTIEKIWDSMHDGFIGANFPDFDPHHGTCRTLSELATRLIELDRWLGHFLPQIHPEDLVIITGSHGHDPAFRGPDPDREDLPLFAITGERCGPLNGTGTFADISATLLAFFELQEKWPLGKSFFSFKRSPLFYY